MIIPLEWMPPLMFAGLVVFMIIGYPVAFSLAAVGFFFGFISIEFGYFTMPFMQAFNVNEHSSNAGGLLRWPIKIVLPVGFVLVALQGLSELIKRVAFLNGHPVESLEAHYERPTQ